MVFKSIAAIARHSALAKNLFVASTATSAQPAFFVSTQQLARQQATVQAQQLITRGFHQSFSSSGPGTANGNSPSANGAAFPSYGPSYNASTLSVSTSSSSDDDKRLSADLQKPGKRALVPTRVVPGTSILIEEVAQVRRVSTASPTSPKSITEHGEPDGASEMQTIETLDQAWFGTTPIADEERLVEVDDETAASIMAASNNNGQPQQQQVQLYHHQQHITSPVLSQVQTTEPPLPPKVSEEQEPAKFSIHEPVSHEQAAEAARDAAASEHVVDTLFSAGNHEGVVAHYSLMKAYGTVPTLGSFNKIMIAQSTRHYLPENAESGRSLLDTYAHMLNCHLVPDVSTYSTVILALVDRYEQAQTLYTESYKPVMARHTISVPAFASMNELLRADSSLDMALDIFFASVSVRQQNYPIEVYNALLAACADSSEIERGLEVLKILDPPDMQREDPVEFSADTYISLLRLFGRTSNVTSVTNVFEDYTKVFKNLSDRKEVEVYAELIRAYFRCGDIASALTSVEKMSELPIFRTEESSLISDAIIEGLLLTDDYHTAWNWIKVFQNEKLPNPSLASISALLSVASRQGDFGLATEIYTSMVATYGVSDKWTNCLSEYMKLCMLDKTEGGLARFIDILEHVLASKVKFEMHMARDAAIYLLEHPNGTEDTIHQAFFLVQFCSRQVPRSYADEILTNEILLDSLLKMMLVVKWDRMTSPSSILSKVLSSLNTADYNSTVGQSLLSFTFPRLWTSISAGIIPEYSEFNELAYHHARYVVEMADKPMTGSMIEAIQSLSSLLTLAAERSIALSEQVNYFVTLAAPILNKYVTESISHLMTPPIEMIDSAFQQPVFLVPADQMTAPALEVAPWAEDQVYEAEPSDFNSPKDASNDLSREVLRRIIAENSPTDVMEYVREIYAAGQSIPVAVVQKFIAYAGDCHSVGIAEEVFDLVTRNLAPYHSSPAMYFIWSSLLQAMLSMYLEAGGKQSLLYKERLVDFKQRLIDMGSAPSASTYANLILKLKLAGSHDEASEAVALFKESQAFGIQPSTYLYNALLSKLSKARRLKEALFYFDEMIEMGLKRTSVTYGTMISASCRAGDQSTAEQLFAEMESSPEYRPRIAPFNTMLQFYVTFKKDRALALKYFNKMRQCRLTPSSHSYKLLIDAYATIEPQDIDAAKHVLNIIAADGQEVTTSHYAALITAQGCIRKDVEQASMLFKDVVLNKAVRPDEIMFQALIESYVENDLIEPTDRIVSEMESKYRIRLTAYMANVLIRGWASTNIDRSREIFDDVYSRRKVEPSTFEAMVRAYLSVDMEQQSAEILKLMTMQGYPDVLVLRISDLIKFHNRDPSGGL